MDYPIEAIRSALKTALEYGVSDLERLERMVLRNVPGGFFRLPERENDDG
jgi:hypothetical protein